MRQTLSAPRGMVSAPHHLAAQAGLAVLREGGNAIEAMVAAASTVAVVYPHMNSIGGDGFWLVSEPGKPPTGIDACGRSAALASIDYYRARNCSAIPSRGPLAANTVAGAISGWQSALELSSRWGGRLPLARLLADALWYARNGAPVTRSQHKFTTRFLEELAPQPGFAGQYLDHGSVPQPETLRRYPALANTLERLSAAGLDDFYRGELAAAMAAELERAGSPLRRDDLAQHRALQVRPLSVDLACGTLYNMTPPTQGLASLMILGVFERLGCRQADGFEHLHGIVESTKQAFLVRNRYLCDPDQMKVNPADFLAPAALDRMAAAIDRNRALPWPEPAAKGDTVWMGACDGEGRMVSYIQSVYWEFGSGVVLSDTGVTWQNRGSSFLLDANSHIGLAPGRKPFHTLNPACARLRDGRTMVYGTMGGDGQPQTQAAVFSRYALFGQPLQQAVSAPRWLLGRTWGQESVSLKLEGRIAAQVVEALRRAGHNIEVLEDWSDSMGHAGAIVLHPGGLITGAADPRSDGLVAGC